MGWASGSDIAVELITIIQREVPSASSRRRIYRTLLQVLTDHDWDTTEEAAGIDPVFDKLLDE